MPAEGKTKMKRCRDCAGEVYGDDVVCSKCLTNEWREMHSANRNRSAIDSCNHEYNRRQRIRNTMHNGVIFAILFLLAAAFVANIPDALNYETIKLQRVRELTGK